MSETVHSIARTVRPHWSHRFRVLAIGLIGAVLVWLVDGLFFGFLIFQPANSSGWDTYRWYNFEHRWRTVQAERSQRAREPLVLIVGSSIAKYSVQEHVLEPVLGERLGRSVMVRPIVHAAMMPTDLVYYTERIRDLQPDLVVYITGPADADLERYKPPWEVGPAYNQQNAFRYVARRHPMYIFYSGQFAYDHFDRLTLTEFTRLQLYANFDVLKFRDEWTEPVWFNLQSGDHPRRSYLNYQGIRIPQGTWREGHTASCMRVPATVLALNPEGTTTPSNDRAVNGADRIIDLEVTPALAAIPGFHIDFYYQHRTQSTTDGA
ncbi:MAG: hypothetical protein KDK34_03790, partial [Leptospiraceae bacterium]|nr:hypothetical protein [Leptospiraceae bacterium]